MKKIIILFVLLSFLTFSYSRFSSSRRNNNEKVKQAQFDTPLTQEQLDFLAEIRAQNQGVPENCYPNGSFCVNTMEGLSLCCSQNCGPDNVCI
jgi:hypothetical protein